MGDALKWIEEGFEQEFSSILRSRAGVEEGLLSLGDQEAVDLGRRAAREALAPLLWKTLAGDVIDTTQVGELLEISRQAINKRVRHRSLLALRGQRTTYFPTWQFDLDRRQVRPVVKDVLQVFADALGEFDPLMVVSWSHSPQYEELDGLTPQEWVEKDGSDDALKLSAKRAAAALSA